PNNVLHISSMHSDGCGRRVILLGDLQRLNEASDQGKAAGLTCGLDSNGAKVANFIHFLPSQIDINPGPDGRFGFTIVGDSPLMVEDCMPNGPAGRSGLKAGDYVMEVNGIPVKHHETAAAMIKAAQGRPLRLGVLSMSVFKKINSTFFYPQFHTVVLNQECYNLERI
uniref:PDZ domain-containing protein n=1 Tax=Pundamilia nyererei TaxID=303518 RepID=A0A3B4GPR8_9CICH